MARESGYQLLTITLDPRELDEYVLSQQVTIEKPDAHNVSRDTLIEMIQEYNTYDDLLNSRILIDREKHIHCGWDDRTNSKVSVGDAKHFDCDLLIRILPHEYKVMQDKIGISVLGLVKR